MFSKSSIVLNNTIIAFFISITVKHFKDSLGWSESVPRAKFWNLNAL